MYTYLLKTQSGEVINKIKAESKAESEKIFAKLKRLSVKDLLKIFKVEKES